MNPMRKAAWVAPLTLWILQGRKVWNPLIWNIRQRALPRRMTTESPCSGHAGKADDGVQPGFAPDERQAEEAERPK